jgi:hypothetical protein
MSLAWSFSLMVVSPKSKPARSNVVAVAKRAEGRERQMSKLQGCLDEFKKTFESGAPPYNTARSSRNDASSEKGAQGLPN